MVEKYDSETREKETMGMLNSRGLVLTFFLPKLSFVRCQPAESVEIRPKLPRLLRDRDVDFDFEMDEGEEDEEAG